jgi:hypothetical protein
MGAGALGLLVLQSLANQNTTGIQFQITSFPKKCGIAAATDSQRNERQ